MVCALKSDYEVVKRRYDAFWNCEMVDRPPVSIVLPGEKAKAEPPKKYSSFKEMWLDIHYRAEMLDRQVRSTRYLYDALPVAWPNLGPEIFSAWCGCGYEYGQDTTWSEPVIEDWDRDAGKVRLNMEHMLFQKTVEFTRLLLSLAKQDYIVGMTDLHPGGDHVAALRDPQSLALDLIENPEWVHEMLSRAVPDFFAAYGVFYHMLREANMPITSWIPLIHDGTFGIPSNDFSCMISQDMFEEFFLPGIVQECRFYERSIYHLDGPGALRHLDALLNIKELNAVQWVCGAGNEGYDRWISVYQKIQKAHKGIMMQCDISELDRIFETLRPEGVWFSGISGIDSEETAARVVARIEKWR